MARRLTMANLEDKSFTTCKRINWKRLCEEWDKIHPHDHNDPAGLKLKYYRAIAEDAIQKEYFARKDREYAGWWADLSSDLIKKLSSDNLKDAHDIMHVGRQLPEGFGTRPLPRSFESVRKYLLKHRNQLQALQLNLAIDTWWARMTNEDQETALKLLNKAKDGTITEADKVALTKFVYRQKEATDEGKHTQKISE